MICLVADLQELKANPDRPATGVVLEAKLDRGRGPVATVLAQNGTLHTGDNFVVGNVFGKVRAMFDDRGSQLDQAAPLHAGRDSRHGRLARSRATSSWWLPIATRPAVSPITANRRLGKRTLAKTSRVSLEGLAEQIKTAGTKELNIILKGDVQGSVEVLGDLLGKMSNDKVRMKVLHAGVGAITESDVLLASASNAIIIGFNVRPERKAQELAEQEEVDIRLHSIIYELQDEIKRAMTGLLEPTSRRLIRAGRKYAKPSAFRKLGRLPAAACTDGFIKRDSEVRLLRDNVVVFKGKVGSLRRFKDDASEVTQRHGVRHLHRQLRRHQSRRRNRSLRDREGRRGSDRLKQPSAVSHQPSAWALLILDLRSQARNMAVPALIYLTAES